MNRRIRAIFAAVAATAAFVALTGCGVIGTSADTGAAPAPTATTAGTPASTGSSKPSPTGGTPAPSGTGGLGTVKDSGDLPDPCTLITTDKVRSLTGRAITQRDEDGGKSGDVTRFCQWQLAGGQLAVFLARTTEADFRTTTADAKPVSGIGEEAFTLAGHLYVLYGTVQIDVYARGGSDAENLAVARKTVEHLIPQV